MDGADYDFEKKYLDRAYKSGSQKALVKNLAIGFIGSEKAARVVVNDTKTVQDSIYLSSSQITVIFSTWL